MFPAAAFSYYRLFQLINQYLFFKYVMQFSDRFVHFSIQLLYSTLRYPNPWTLATFCIGTYTLYNLFTYWYSARFCQGNARRRTFFQVKKRSERDGSSISPAQGSFSISARLQVDRAILRGGVAQKRRALVEEAQHLLLAAADVELGLHDLIELLARHAERGVAREAV